MIASRSTVAAVIAMAALLAVGRSSPASADDCAALGGVVVGAECQVSGAVVASDQAHGGPFAVDRTLRIMPTGAISVPEMPGGSSFTLAVRGNLIMEVPADANSSRITGDASTGTAADIALSTTGSIRLRGDGTLGARISASRTRTSCPGGAAGKITLHAGGEFTAEPGTSITSNSSCGVGEIIITASSSANLGGLIASDGSTTTGRGGPISVTAGCTLTVGNTGVVRSKGADPGADRVHVEGGCLVVIEGLVASTGPGHWKADNRCHGSERPDKPADAPACVEVWSGGTLIIDSSAAQKGEINADTAQSGGTLCCAWVDLLAADDIRIIGSATGPYSVHANQFLSNGAGGIVTVKSGGGDVSASGRAIEASTTNAGGRGGSVTVEAAGDTILDTAQIVAQGDLVATGGFGSGGAVEVRAFSGAARWKKTAASTPTCDVQPTGSGIPAAQRGVVILSSCGQVDLTGTAFPVTVGAATSPTVTQGVCPPTQPDAPEFAGYVQLPACGCANQEVVVAKSTTTPLVSPGESVSYGIEVTATGGLTATNVMLMDTLPAGIKWTVTGPDAGACAGGPVLAGGATLTCLFGTLSPGDVKSITLTATAKSGSCPSISNTASVLWDSDAGPGSNSSGPVVIAVRCSDVKVVKTATTPIVDVGGNAVYSVVVTANGPGSSNGVVMTDVLPAGLTWAIGGPDAAACTPASPVPGGTTLTCNFGLMLSGGTKTVTLTAATTSASCPAISNTAVVRASGDSTPANNTSGPVTIQVMCAPDISIVKTTTTPSVKFGQNASYAIAVSAGGTADSTNVKVKDVLPGPATMLWTVSGPDAGACSPNPVAGGSMVKCNFGTMTPGSVRSIVLTAPTTEASCGSLSNTATVVVDRDANPANNSSGPVVIDVTCPDVSIVKVATTPTIGPGDLAQYTVTVTANGPYASKDVTLTDPLPVGWLWTVSGPDAAACTPASPVPGGTTLTCQFGKLAAGASRSITLSGVTALTWDFSGPNTVAGTAAGADYTIGGHTVHLDAFVASTATANGTPAFVYGKSQGHDETGAGVCAQASGSPLTCLDTNSAHEIDADQDGTGVNNGGMIRIDLGPAFASLGNFSVQLGSVQVGEYFEILTGDSGSIGSAVPIYSGTNLAGGVAIPLSGVKRYVFVRAGAAGDVLLYWLSAAYCTGLVNTATVTATVDNNVQNNSSGPVAIAVAGCQQL